MRAELAYSRRPLAWSGVFALVGLLVTASLGSGGETPAVARFQDQVLPVLVDYCYRCHGDGMEKGGIAFDGFDSDATIVKNRDLWWAVLKNVRAGIMPPAEKPHPDPKEIQVLANWIKRDVFGLDPNHPDPGRVTIRRLNRVEYRNTIKDLMGIEFKAEEEFPPDDTGYGFDNIGDVLTVSPLLLEKYFQAAETIVKTAVPTVSKRIPERTYRGVEFRGEERGLNGDRLAFTKAAKVSHAFSADPWEITDLRSKWPYGEVPRPIPAAARSSSRWAIASFFMTPMIAKENKTFHYTFDQHLTGDQRLSFEIQPAADRGGKDLSARGGSWLKDRYRTRSEDHLARSSGSSPFESRGRWTHDTGCGHPRYGRFSPRTSLPADPGAPPVCPGGS